MVKMRKKHLWSKEVEQICKQQRTTKITHLHRCFSHAFCFIGCIHTKDIQTKGRGFCSLHLLLTVRYTIESCKKLFCYLAVPLRKMRNFS